MERGHVLALWRAGSAPPTAPPPAASRAIRLPDERHGLLFVFRTFDRVSYALILSCRSRCAPATASPSPDGRARGRHGSHPPAMRRDA
jgi:hypothetical protein